MIKQTAAQKKPDRVFSELVRIAGSEMTATSDFYSTPIIKE